MYQLGAASINELQGVHPHLVAVVKRAIELSQQDFAVHDGIRNLEQQQQLVAAGASKTLDSRHISGHAVDLVPYINGKLRWEWPPIYQIAVAVRQAAQELAIPIRWGGAWDIDFSQSSASPEQLVTDYSARRRQANQSVFIDGPHFELPKSHYPS